LLERNLFPRINLHGRSTAIGKEASLWLRRQLACTLVRNVTLSASRGHTSLDNQFRL
jgi:hypothetical protein